MEHKAGQISFLGQVQTGPDMSNLVKNIGANMGEIEGAAKPFATRGAQACLMGV